MNQVELQLTMLSGEISGIANKYNQLNQSLSSTISHNNDEVMGVCTKIKSDLDQLCEVLDSFIRYTFADEHTTPGEAESLVAHLNSFLNREK